MPNKAYACPRCGLPTLLPNFADWGKGQEMHSTCINCGFVAIPNERRGSNKLLTDEWKDESKKRGEETKQMMIDGMGSEGGSMPNRKTEFPEPRKIFQHPLQMILADTGHESLSDLIREYSRLKAERDARLPDSIRPSISDADQQESELAEQKISGFEERNAEHLLNTFLNMKRRRNE